MAKQATAEPDSTVDGDKRTVQDYLDVPLGITEGPGKNLATIGDLLQSYDEIVKAQGKTTRDLKAATARIDSIDDKGKGPLKTELWDRAISDVEANGSIGKETMAALEQATGIPSLVFSNVVGVMQKADEAFGVKTKEALGVDSAKFHEMMEEAGYSPAYQEFMQDQILAGRYGFLSDVADDLKSKGIVDANSIGQKSDGDNSNDPTAQPKGQEQIPMGDTPAQPAPDKGWESDGAFQNEFNLAKSAQQAGDSSKMTAIESRMAKLETAGVEFYPDAPKSITIG